MTMILLWCLFYLVLIPLGQIVGGILWWTYVKLTKPDAKDREERELEEWRDLL